MNSEKKIPQDAGDPVTQKKVNSNDQVKDFKENLGKYNINPKRALFTLALCTFIDVLGYTLIMPLLPQIAKGFGASDILIGLIISSNAFTALVFGPILGKLSDKYGRKKLLIVSMLGTLGSFILLLFSTNLAGLLLSRLFDGVFSGQIPIIRAYTADVSHKNERTSIMGKMMASFSMGLILGPSIGGLLGSLDWRYPVLFAVFISILATTLVFKVLAESMPKERRDALQKEKQLQEEINGKKEPLLTKPLVLRLLQTFFQILAFNAFVSTLPLVLEERFAVGPAEIGFVFTVYGIEMIIFSGLILRKLLKKFGEKPLYIASMAILVISFIIYPFLDNYWYIIAFVTPPTVGMALFRPIVQSNITKAAPDSRQGEANGWGTNMQGLAQVFAPIIATGYLEVGTVVIFGLAINAYFMIGWTMAFLFALVFVIVIIDVKSYPHDFEEKEIKRLM